MLGLAGIVGQDKNLAYNHNLEMGIQTVVQHHQLRSCKILQQKNSKAWELSNPSHPPCFAQVTSQYGCHFTLAIQKELLELRLVVTKPCNCGTP
jgi:hypothetical protein